MRNLKFRHLYIFLKKSYNRIADSGVARQRGIRGRSLTCGKRTERTVKAVKKRNYIGVLLGLGALTVLGGCYEPLEITEQEMDIVAEYAATVLIRHGTQTDELLLNRREQEKAQILSATPTPRPTPEPTDSPGKEDHQQTGVTQKPEATAVPDNTEITMQDLTELLAKENFFFRYTGYKADSVYQGAGELFAAAEEGKQLIVLEFDVTNQSSGALTLSMSQGVSKEFVYTLRVGGTSVKPSLTLLQEDLYTSYEVDYAAGETKKGVLVFECPLKESEDSMTLTILKKSDGKDDSVLIKIK